MWNGQRHLSPRHPSLQGMQLSISAISIGRKRSGQPGHWSTRCTTATEWKYCQETASRKERWSDAHSDALQRRPLVVSAPTDSTRRCQDAKGLEDWRCTTTASSSARRYNKVIAKHKAKQTTLSADWPGRN
ncbi:uncharacterized protein CIMG_07802 [Coccidioides immitis RS]|uniref:Uncharacterized protein n=1 Tax=Coccidioides immitis (strain RS) TaxID=246410 RepID=J3K455_COCIM|nr:uncharacterized protein CIMG_07802 [Coccidioides immitis RS]EAS29056.3 hypothetical protein CIMG_07802 [Coccidioides immitis RS]